MPINPVVALDRTLDELAGVTPVQARPGRHVASLVGTTPPPDNEQVNEDYGKPTLEDVDALFGNTQGYLKVKHEKFQHRLLLWYKLQGLRNDECAKLLRYTPSWVSQICSQPWFQRAFVDLAKEMGKDAITTFLQGEVLPAIQRTAELARNGDSDQVKLAANREILDRFLGKSTVKVESKATVDINNTVIDAAKLLEEQRRLDEQLKANGLVQHGRS